jgi:hypothetical protein
MISSSGSHHHHNWYGQGFYAMQGKKKVEG